MSRYLLCRPDHFGVSYEINPWMKNQIDKVNKATAVEQWQNLYITMSQVCNLELLPSQQGCPDLVFTANAGLVHESMFIPSRFKNPERQPEEAHFKQWFEQQKHTIKPLPDVSFEGAGDALFSANKDILWMGHGHRTDELALHHLQHLLGKQIMVKGLKLVNPHHYHLDTCFCPLESGHVVYYPKALDRASNQLIEAYYKPSERIVVNDDDAQMFACNMVSIPSSQNNDFNFTAILNDCSDDLYQKLKQADHHVIKTPMSEFMKSGGSVKCLTLKLPD